MTRIRRIEKLSKKDQESLLFDLVNAIVQSKNINEAALLLQDLMTRSEITALAKRLRIAKLLIEGKSYEQIETNLNVSHGTIAKIAAWLTDRGEGFRNILRKLPKEAKSSLPEEISDWNRIKRRHGLYFWPEILLEEIVKNANKKQKERISNILDRMEEKSELHRNLEKLLKYRTT